MKTTVNGEAEITAALELVAHAPVVIIDGLLGIIIGLDARVGNNVQPGHFLIVGQSEDHIFERFPLEGIWRQLIACEETCEVCIPPTGVWVIPNHACRECNLLVSNLHGYLLDFDNFVY